MTTVTPPEKRSCERCGRREVWSEDRETWVEDADGDAGRPHCVHEWDITGSYNPISEQH